MKYRVTIARTVKHSVLIEAKDQKEIIDAIEVAKQKGLIYDKYCNIENIEQVNALYAISVEDSKGNFGTTHGPTTDIQRLLEIVPKFPLSKIIDLPDKIIYDWNDEIKKWVIRNEVQT